MKCQRLAYCALACVALVHSVVAADNSKPPASHRLLSATEIKEPEPMPYQRGSKHMLVINAGSLLQDAKLNPKSTTWDAVHRELRDFVKTNGGEHAVHVRLFYENGVYDRKMFGRLREHLKKRLADLNVYIVMVDMHARNDETKWESYLEDLNKRISTK